MELYVKAVNAFFRTVNLEHELLNMRLMLFLSSPEGSINRAEVNAWMPSPKAIADIQVGNPWFRSYSFVDIASLGERAFLKLGRDDEACELARLVLSSEPKLDKKWILMQSHCVLGQVAAKRGNLDEADVQFASALEEAKLSRLPMLEVLAARDWKRYLLEPNGRDASGAEAVIDGACAAMEISRGEISSVL